MFLSTFGYKEVHTFIKSEPHTHRHAPHRHAHTRAYTRTHTRAHTHAHTHTYPAPLYCCYTISITLFSFGNSVFTVLHKHDIFIYVHQ